MSFSSPPTFLCRNSFTLQTSASATFTANNATVDIDGSFTVWTGTFNAPAGTMYVGGDWTRSGGTFNHNSGTVIFDGGSATAQVPVTETFNNLTINKTSGQTLTITTGDTLKTLGTLWL